MIIAVNEHPEMRRVVGELEMRTVDITYTMGGGTGAVLQELVIHNWKNGWLLPGSLAR
jgi:hypothetical protein